MFCALFRHTDGNPLKKQIIRIAELRQHIQDSLDLMGVAKEPDISVLIGNDKTAKDHIFFSNVLLDTFYRLIIMKFQKRRVPGKVLPGGSRVDSLPVFYLLVLPGIRETVLPSQVDDHFHPIVILIRFPADFFPELRFSPLKGNAPHGLVR